MSPEVSSMMGLGMLVEYFSVCLMMGTETGFVGQDIYDQFHGFLYTYPGHGRVCYSNKY